MLDKLDYYDIVAIAVPGVLLAYWIAVCFPRFVAVVNAARFPESINAIGFVALALMLGHLVQAAGSILEGLLYPTWGGRPSERALSKGLGDHYLPAATGKRIRKKLACAVDSAAPDRALFLWALERAKADPSSRSERFNALYGYHRALVVLAVTALALLVASAFWGAARSWSTAQFVVWLVVLLAVVGLLWSRAKRWAFYYVREVLQVTERVIDAGSVPSPQRLAEAEQEKS